MTFHAQKGDVHVLCDTEEELAIAIAVLNTDTTVREMPSVAMVPVVNGMPAGAPDWRVGGPRDERPIGTGILGDADVRAGDTLTPDQLARLEAGKPTLTVVPTESDDSVTNSPTVQHVPVSARQYDILEAVMLFPEGVQCKGVAQLLGLTDKQVGGRMQMLKRAGLVELVPHTTRWRATTLARRAKLVKC